MSARTLLILGTLSASAICFAQSAGGDASTGGLSSASSAASASAGAASASMAAGTGQGPLYTVVDGYKVDANTLKGFHVWRAAACDRCHGANQEGLVGPSLIDSFKTLTKAQVYQTLHDGRLEKGMPSWAANKQVMDNFNDLYAYLKGRSDGAITRAHVEPLSAQ
jgi:mono/diheme cytochrome c family protein